LGFASLAGCGIGNNSEVFALKPDASLTFEVVFTEALIQLILVVPAGVVVDAGL